MSKTPAVAMTTSGVWDPKAGNFEMKRKSSFSVFSVNDPTSRPRPVASDEQEKGKHEKLWNLMANYKANDVDSVQKDVVSHVEYSLACTRFGFSKEDAVLGARRLPEAFLLDVDGGGGARKRPEVRGEGPSALRTDGAQGSDILVLAQALSMQPILEVPSWSR